MHMVKELNFFIMEGKELHKVFYLYALTFLMLFVNFIAKSQAGFQGKIIQLCSSTGNQA